MRIFRCFMLVLAAGLAAGLAVAAVVPVTAAPPSVPTLVAIRAAHHPGFDRIVFQFTGGLPTSHHVQYVDVLRGDASGLPIPVAGRAILSVGFDGAQAHDSQGPTVPARKAFALPNIMTTVRAGDFEAVTTYGVGLAKRSPFTVSWLHDPDRVVIDIRAAFPTVDRRVFFFDSDATGPPSFASTTRPVRPGHLRSGCWTGSSPGRSPARGATGSGCSARTRRVSPTSPSSTGWPASGCSAAATATGPR